MRIVLKWCIMLLTSVTWGISVASFYEILGKVFDVFKTKKNDFTKRMDSIIKYRKTIEKQL